MTPSVPSNQEYVRIGFDKIFQGGHVSILVNNAGVAHIGDPEWPRLDEVAGSHFFSVQMKARSSPEWTTSIDGGFMNLCG